MPNLIFTSEQKLLQEMEALRQELDQVLQENPELLGSPQVYALSARLDTLIACYMQLVNQGDGHLTQGKTGGHRER